MGIDIKTLSERRETQKATYSMIPSFMTFQKRENWTEEVSVRAGERRQLTTKEDKGSLVGDKKSVS